MKLEKVLKNYNVSLMDIASEIEVLNKISERVIDKNGDIFLVGGFPRDLFTGQKNKDLDVEIYGLSKKDLKDLLSQFGQVNEVGASFGVLKIHGYDIDFSLPRREFQAKVLKDEKQILVPTELTSSYMEEISEVFPLFQISVAPDEEYRHVDFIVIPDPYLSFLEASKRRDFTMNSLMLNLKDGTILDNWNGIEDIQNGIIRHIDPQTFIQDALRVLRACQFASRFEFKIAPETIELCKDIPLSSLHKERIFEELSKALLKSEKPSIAFEYMRELRVVGKLFPELETLINCSQRPDFHPEGSVWNHTMMVLNEASKLRRDETFMFGALCHDLGKPSVTHMIDGQIKAPGHDEKGVEVARQFMLRLTTEVKLIQGVLHIVENHMRPHSLYPNSSAKAIRKFAYEVDVETILLIAEADYKGRAVPNRDYSPIRTWFDERLRDLGADKKIERVVTGKDLISLGMKPGVELGEMLKKALELQFEGWSKEYILKSLLSCS